MEAPRDDVTNNVDNLTLFGLSGSAAVAGSIQYDKHGPTRHTERVVAMLESMDELSAHPPASFLYVSGSGVYSVRVRAVPSGDGAGNRMGSCRARERVTIHGALRKRRAQRYCVGGGGVVKSFVVR